MAANIDPQLLAQILAMQQGRGASSGGGNVWYDPNLQTDDPMAYMLHQYLGMAPDAANGYSAESGVMARDPSQDQNFITKLIQDTGGKIGDQWDTKGNYVGQVQLNDGGGRDMNQALAMIIGGYFGGNALNGAYGGGGAAAGTVTANDVAMMAANGMTDAQIATAIGSEAAQAMGLAGAGTGMTFAETTALAAEQGATNTAAEEAAKKAAESSIGNGAKNAVDAAGWAKTLLPIAGAVTGAIDAGDKEQTSSRDPWAPAQPYLKGLLSDGAQLYDQYKQQPFSQSQQAGYTNIGSLLDLVNNNAGGLLSGFQANASGANQFQRGSPGLLQGSSFNPTAEQWRPVGFGDMGMTQFRRGR